jgi:uncharacterized protein
MENQFAPTRLDVKALALSASKVSGHDLLSRYERLTQDLQGQGPDLALNWRARGESRLGTTGKTEPWLHLNVDTALPMVCQRCMGPISIPVTVEREFRFVANEEEAAAQDDESDEDLLVLSREFNLHELIEDELLMGLPLIPRHDVCPTAVKLEAVDPDFEVSTSVKPNPFAVLAKLQSGKSD